MGNSSVKVVRPVAKVRGQVDVPLCDRTAVLGAFFHAEQGSLSGLIIITCGFLENFSPKTGVLKYSVRLQPEKQALRSNFNPASALGPCVFVACTDGKIRAYEAVKFKEIAEFGHSQDLTVLICPLNNALVCGYRDGSLRSFFIETRQQAGIYKPDNTSSPDIVTPVSCVSYYKPKNWIAVGYETSTSSSSSSSSVLLLQQHRRNVPVVLVFALESNKVLKRYYNTAAAQSKTMIVLTYLTEDNKYLLASTSSCIYTWDAVSTDRLYDFDFVTTMLGGPTYRCLACCADPKEGVLFMAFNAGFFGAMRVILPGTQHWAQKYAADADASSSNLIQCEPMKLFQAAKDDDLSELCSPDVAEKRGMFQYIWYDSRTQTIIVGNGCGEARLVPDFFGRQTAKEPPQRHDHNEKPVSLPVVSLQYNLAEVRDLSITRRPTPTAAACLPFFSLNPMADIRKATKMQAKKTEGQR